MSKDIAIIGMAGRFPDAKNLDELFANLVQGRDSVREISAERLKNTTLPLDQDYRICGYLEDVDKFDCHFFNISLAEAQTMEPNQRLLLEVVYEIFENAAYSIDSFAGSNTCVYVAEAGNDYHKHTDKILPTLITGNAREFLAARLARQYNLRGSAAMVNTSCSSALVAVHLACNELILKDADYALVCAVHIDLFPYNDNSLNLGLLSPDGKSRAFSSRANGMSRGETAAGVLLKPLDKAIKDKDIIHAVIKGSAVNNNAKSSASLSAPDSQSQAKAIRKAWEKAGINPMDIGFIEAHGSGTELGDSLEIEGLDLAFQEYTNKKRFCPISTIKSNVGHGVFASGMSGLIEAVLSLKHQVIFPTIHFDTPNPLIDFDHSAVYVNETLKKWDIENGKSRIAGVSSIGFSGTNCHMVLQEAPRPETDEKNNSAPPGEKDYLITVSSKTLTGLKENLLVLLQKINSGNSYRLNDISYTLNKGRKHYNYRFACIARHLNNLKHQLLVGAAGLHSTAGNRKPLPALEKLIFIFSDQEEVPDSLIGFFLSKYPLFKKYFYRCRACGANHRDDNFRHFAFQYSFYKLLASRGISTENILAVGIGRITSAVISGDMTLEQAMDRAVSYKVEEITGLEERVKSLIQKETRDESTAFIELGPGGAISRQLENHDTGDRRFYVFWLNQDTINTDPLLQLLKSLYLANYDIDWEIFFKHQQHEGRMIELPGYRFRKVRCWLREEPAAITGDARAAASTSRALYETGSEIEEKIAGYWQEVLGEEIFYREDNFFERGGDSLKATKVINRINQELMLELDFEDIFDFPTIAALGEYIDSLLGTRQKMALFWKEVLKVQRVEEEDHFFELGGHSLLATQVLNMIKKEYHLELNFEEFFQHPTLLSICQYIDNLLAEGKNKIEYSSIESVEKKEYYPLSSGQKRFYLLQHMNKNNTGYNSIEVLALEGELQRERLEDAFRKLIRRHESFRTCFELVGEEPVQRVHDEVAFEIEYYDLAIEDTESTEGMAPPTNYPGELTLPDEKIIKDFIRPFDLSAAPLLRVGLVKLLHTPTALRSHLSQEGKEGKYLLMVDMHHIITDGTSMVRLTKDFTSLYTGYLLPTLRIQYKDFTRWQNSEKKRALIKQQEVFWLQEFSGEIPVLNLPTDFPRPSVKSFAGSFVDFFIDSQESGALKKLAINEGVTLYMILLTIFYILLSKLTRQEEITIGTAAAGRRHIDLQELIGFFVNTLALKSHPEGQKTVREFLKEVRERTLTAFENQDYPFEDVVENILTGRNTAHHPLFDVMFGLQNIEGLQGRIPEIELPGLKLASYPFDAGTARFDLLLIGMEDGDKLYFIFEYCTRLFKKETIKRFITYFRNIVTAVLNGMEQRISAIDILSRNEREQLLYGFNDTGAHYPLDKSIHRLFEEQADRVPHQVALLYEEPGASGNIEVTYNQLNKKANQLALLLRARGITVDTIVGLLLEPSIDMIVGMLAALKAGGAYMPIEPGCPVNRLKGMVQDSSVAVFLTRQTSEARVGECGYTREVIRLDQLPDVLVEKEKQNPLHIKSPQDLAYVIFTSGSTGKPKGTLISHENVVRLMVNDKNPFVFNSSDVWTLFHSYCFDFSVWEMYGALLYGGKLLIIPRMMARDTQQFLAGLKKHAVTVLNQTPSAFYNLAAMELENPGKQLKLRYVIFGGEALNPAKLDRWYEKYPETRLINMFGITETTVHVTFKELKKREIERGISNIGKPIPTLTTYVTDKHQQLLPIVVPGELCVGGKGVARGYLNRPELTAEKFCLRRPGGALFIKTAPVKHLDSPYKNFLLKGLHKDHMQSCHHAAMQLSPYQSPQYPITPLPHFLIYRSGDLVTLLENGDMVYSGRIDHQVKIRGYRVELEEIAHQIMSHEAVREAVVVDRADNNGDKQLVAYVVPGSQFTLPDLQVFLKKHLPDYMVPPVVVLLDKLPLTPNGKINRRELPESGNVETSISDSPAPGNEREKKLAEIWSDLLGIKKDTIGIHTNFFQSGGQSLKAAVLRTRIHKAFNVKIPMSEIFQRPTIKEMDDYIQGAATDNYTPLQWVEKRDFYALSSAQKRLYILQQMEMANIAYNLPAIMKLEGELRTKGFEEAIKRLIDRHESLRTSFHMIDEQPVQRVHDEVEFEIEYYDSGNRQKAKGKKEEKMPNAYYLMPESLIKNFIRPFDLSRAPLLRIELIKTGEQEHMLMIDMHHIVMDGISLGIFIEEFMMIYGGGKIPVLRHRYKEFLAWQNTEKKAQTFKKQEEYWKKQFEGGIPVLNLPTDYNRPLVSSSAGNQVSFRLSSSETNGLKELGMTERASLFMVLLSVFNVLLFKITGQEDIVVGTPVAGRRHAELQRIIGMFVNTLALRNYPWGEKNHRELLREIKERTLSAFENQDYPFEDLVEQVEINRDTGRNPVFSVMLVLQDMDLPEPEIPGLKLQTLHHGPGGGRFDMTLFAREDRDELAFTLEYGTKLFKKETIIRYVEYFKRIVSLAPGNPDAMLGQIEVIGEAEKRQLIVDFNNTGARYPKEKTLHELFEEQVEKTTDNTAVVFEDQKLTYRVLNQKANQLAQVLRAKNISPDKVVSIMVQPSVEMMVGIFGILKTGGSYLPIDPEYPGKRKNYILQDSKTELVLTSLRAFPGINHESDVGNLNDICEIIDLGDGCLYNGDGRNPEGGNTSTDLAYVIYTSGSIGTPKGVTISHQNVVNFIEGITSRIAFESDKSILALTTISFDIFVLETLLPLIKGLKVIIATQQQRLDPDLLKKIVKNNQMDMIQSTPSRLQLMTEDLHWLKGVKVLMVGGETFPNNLFEGLKKEFGGKIYNLYGPTETTIWSTLKDLTGAGGITIGTPIANTYIYILNRYMGLQPVGAGGELCIGGDGTARGYLNKPELTAEKFDHDFWDYHDEEKKGTNKKLNKKLLQGVQGGGFLEKSPPGRRRQKIYKTGDLARWLQDGEIQFLGRIDHQVKIRGFRIELEEIENHLLQLESVKEVIVSDKEINGNKCLCAFMVSDNEIEISEMRNKLSKVLPIYMIPSYFVQLKKLSLTPNGKIDRKALPDPELTGGDRYTPPRDEMEKRMVKIWAELLHLEENVIGIDTNFFSLGGHSLKAMILATKIHKELDVKIPLAQIFKISSIKGLARYIEQAEQYKSEVVQPVEEKEYYPLTHAQRGILVQQWKLKGVMAYNIPQLVPLDFDVDKDRLSHTFKKLICRHESLRSSFHMIDGKAVQRIQPGRDMELTIEYHDMTGMAGITGQDPRLTSILRDFIRVFNLSQAPLLRVGLIQLKDKKYLLEIDMHHIVTDGVSMEILRKELMELYNSEQLAPIKIQYKDYVVWQRSKKVKEAIDKQKGFWLKNFAGEIPVVNLPLDFKRPTIKRFDGDRIFFTVDSRLTHRLNRLAEHSEATLYMVLLAVYFILLSTFDNPGDIVVGSPVTGRKHADLHNIIGMFVNMLAIKSRPAAEKTFREFLEEVKGIVIDSLENQDYQYGDFIGELGLIGNLSRNPLFDVVFAMHNIRTYVNGNENLENNRYSMELLTAKFDLLLGAAENDGKIVMKFEYSTQLFKRSTVEKMSKHYLEILQQVTAYPDIPRENIEMPHDRVAMKAIDHYDDGDFGF